MLRIRDVTFQDRPAFVALAEAMHAASPGFAPLDFDAQVLGETLTSLRAVDTGYARLAEADHQMVGGMLGIAQRSFFGRDAIAADMGLFVYPDRRGMRAGAHLVTDFCVWAQARDVKRVTLCNGAGVGDAAFTQMLAGLDFQRAGSVMYTLLQGG